MSEPLLEQLQTRAKLCGVQLSPAHLTDINTYCTALCTYGEQVNLVSRTDLDFLLFEHVLDSLSLITLIESLRSDLHSTNTLIDIGSGAGFPGLVLGITCPELKVCLVEATAKKCQFLNEAVAALKLDKRVHVINARAEEIGCDRKYREAFQFATVRALGSMELITELAIPLLEVGGYLLAQKSQIQVEEELASGEKIFSAIGAKLERVVELSKEALGKQRVVMIVKKMKATPKQFPRAFSKIAKRKL